MLKCRTLLSYIVVPGLVLSAHAVKAAPTGAEVLQHSGPSRNRIDVAYITYGFQNDQAAERERVASLSLGAGYLLNTSIEWRRYKNFLNVTGVFRDSVADPVAPDWALSLREDAELGMPGYDVIIVQSATGNTPAGECFDYPHGVEDWGGNATGGYHQHVLGHCIHGFGDIYPNATGNDGWPNSSQDPTGAHWSWWLGFTEPFGHLAIGHLATKTNEVVGAYAIPSENDGMGSGYRPTSASYMSCCPQDDFGNPIEREIVVQHFFERWLDPLDSWLANGATLEDPDSLWVDVVDPAVIKVDWFVDDILVQADGGELFFPAKHGLTPGAHKIEALAYDEIVKHAYSDRGGSEEGTPGSLPSHELDWARRKLEVFQQRIAWNVNLSGEPAQDPERVAPRLDDVELVLGGAEGGDQVGAVPLLHPSPDLFRFSAEGDTDIFSVDPESGSITLLEPDFGEREGPFSLCVTAFEQENPANASATRVTLMQAPASVLVDDAFDDGDPQLNPRGIGRGFRRSWRGTSDGSAPEEANGQARLKAGNPTWLIGYDKLPVADPQIYRLTVELGPVDLADGHLDLYVGDSQAGNAEEMDRVAGFGVRDLTQFRAAAADAAPLFERVALVEAEGSVAVDLNQAHTVSLTWSDTSYSFSVDGQESASGTWPDGVISAFAEQEGKAVIAFSGNVAAVERVVVEREPAEAVAWSRPLAESVACEAAVPADVDGNMGGAGGAAGVPSNGSAGASGAGHAATGEAAAPSNPATGPDVAAGGAQGLPPTAESSATGCGCTVGVESGAGARFGAAGLLLLALAARRRRQRGR